MSQESVDPFVVDTREPLEYATSHVEGAVNISVTEFASGNLPAGLVDVAKDRSIILYCRSGQRSNTCSMILRSFGYTNITNGINEHHVRKLLGQE
ncbi:MAG: rhodanese-like domain-containing protein [Candidatus Saccharimonas sp.]